MNRRSRHRPAKREAAESLMDFYLRNRASADTSIDTDLARSCTTKQQYASEAQARAIATMQGMSGSLYTYHCRYCDFWHLTRRPNSGPSAPLVEDE
jgi:hypothetical protein